MKKLILTIGLSLGLFLLASQVFAGGYWQEKKCVICSKRIYYYVEHSDYFHDGIAFWPGRPSCSIGEKVSEIGYELSLRVCGECRKLYKEELRKLLTRAQEEWLIKLREKHKEDIKRNQEETRQYHLKKLQDKIKETKKRLKELEDK